MNSEFNRLLRLAEQQGCVDVKHTVLESFARTLFVMAWSQRETEQGRTHPGQELMDVAPPTSGEAYWDGAKALNQFEKLNQCGLNELYAASAAYKSKEHRKVPTPKDFGHALAMQSLGSGVSWADDHPHPGFEVPRIEFRCR